MPRAMGTSPVSLLLLSLSLSFSSSLLLHPCAAFAQDAHYWTLQYGPSPSLLGGAVIGSVNDVSATFYNPGALSRAENLSFAVSMNVFEVNGVVLRDGGGEGVDLGRATTGLRPSMIAGTFADSLFGAGVLAYSAMNRVKGTQDFQGLISRGEDRLDPDLGIEDLVGIIRFEGDFSDFWGGLTYSHRIGSHFGIGMTGYLAARSQRRRNETLVEAVFPNGSGEARIEIAGGNYSTIRLLGKFGAFARFGDMRAGVTLTTPSSQLTGSGELGLNYARFSPDGSSLAFTIQSDLPTHYKTPLSIGGGVGLPLGPLLIHASAEWYDKIDRYVVIQGETINAQEPEDQQVPVDAVHELAEVFNWGVGTEFRFSKRFMAYLSYYQDNSALTDEIERASLSALPIDIQTITIGTDFRVGPALMTLGLGYGWGEKSARELLDIIGDDSELKPIYVYTNFRALFGFEIGV
ncbi:hypothetical protein ACFLRO_00710 [Bacteroidota bacterium]